MTINAAAANADTRIAHISSDLPGSGGAPGTSGPTAGTGGRSTPSLMSCPLDRSQVSSASGRSRRMPRNPITTQATKICMALRDESAAAFSARA